MTLYVNQKCRVHSKPGSGNGEIRITFNEMNPEPVTLALTLVEASWLSARIGMEIRRVESGEAKNPGTRDVAPGQERDG